MIRTSLSTALVAAGFAFCAVPAANAQYYDQGYTSYGYTGSQPIPHTSNCEKQRDENRVAGAVVGAIAGGLLGSAIGG
ncbi:MAG: hypothetical protein AAGJ85_02595, partial [Pseudomonadota bacterium]